MKRETEAGGRGGGWARERAAELLWRGCRDSWDKKYVEVEDEVLFHLILAANFLDIKDLLDLTCKTVRAASLSLFLCPSVDARGAVQGPSERMEETQGREREREKVVHSSHRHSAPNAMGECRGAFV